eukprot:scaffold155436_cov30-Tisochrysis_lutea.AAC.3
MSTLEPRRFLMLATKAPKRGAGLMISSGMKIESDKPGLGLNGGEVKSPTPIIGKQGTVGQISSAARFASSRARRIRMFRSTCIKSAAKPEYGLAGVPSTIHDPHSGIQLQCCPRGFELASWSRSVLRISAPRSESFTVPASASSLKIAYSTSSPHSRLSPSMFLTRW